MRELPILMNGAMVRAVLDGRKTVTRRVIKSIPWRPGVNPNFSQARAFSNGPEFRIAGSEEMTRGFRCPYGAVGDRLYVRETTVNVEDHGYIGPVFAASAEGRTIRAGGLGPADDDCEVEPEDVKLRTALHMPKAWARIWLQVTAVRVERLRQISPSQALREGLVQLPASGRFAINAGDQHFGGASHDYAEVFSWLWDDVSKPGTRWADNPWVWVIEFERIEKEVPHVG